MIDRAETYILCVDDARAGAGSFGMEGAFVMGGIIGTAKKDTKEAIEEFKDSIY